MLPRKSIMSEYKYALETCNDERVFDNTKRKSVEICPFCGKSNKDGKFVPYAGFKDRGHCFSCGRYSPIGEHTCPSCKAEKAFNRYVDSFNNEYIDNSVGKCFYCEYHYPPKQYFEDKAIVITPLIQKHNKTSTWQGKTMSVQSKPVNKPVSFIPIDIFKASLKNHDENNFVRYLISLFGAEITNQLISRYFIATSKHWPGANVFWQIDISGKVRAGKIMLYNSINGKRIKEPVSRVDWVHSVMKYQDFKLRQCFFGEHLLHDITKPVALVESEKTAIIASIYLPQFIWLAVGGKEGLNPEKCKILAGRSVTLFPDLNAFDLWNTKTKELSNIAQFTVSGLLECKATEPERFQGLDLADYLTKFDYKAFYNQQTIPENNLNSECVPITIEKPITIENVKQSYSLLLKKDSKLSFGSQPENWNEDIEMLEAFFSEYQLLETVVKLSRHETIIDVSKFIHSHLITVRAYNGNPTFKPYLNRLHNLRHKLNEIQILN